jgi:predicted transcriptional regulator
MNRSSPLGPLESEVMEVMWEKERATVREVVDLLQMRRPLAYTTVMTVMNNLVHKGLLDREPEGKAYRYHVTLTQKAFRERAFRRAIDEVLDVLATCLSPGLSGLLMTSIWMTCSGSGN